MNPKWTEPLFEFKQSPDWFERIAVIAAAILVIGVLGTLGEAQQPPKSKPQPKGQNVAQPRPPAVPNEAAPPAPTQPIPFAPIGPPREDEPQAPRPQAQPPLAQDAQVGVTVYIEMTGQRFLVFDSKGWLPDVKEVHLIFSVDRPSQLDAVSYPGAYAPSNPQTSTAPMPTIKLLSTEEFQAKLDEANGLAPNSEPIAQK